MSRSFAYKRVIAEIVPLAILELTAELASGSFAPDTTEADAVMALGVSVGSGYRGSKLPDLDHTSLPLYRGIARRARVYLGQGITAGVYDPDETAEVVQLVQEIADLERFLGEFEQQHR